MKIIIMMVPWLVLHASVAASYEVVTDDVLSEEVGGVGVTLLTSLDVSTQSFKLHDTNGIADGMVTGLAGYANKGSLVAKGLGISGCTELTGGGDCTRLGAASAFRDPSLSVVIDSSGGAGGVLPVLKATVNWLPGTNKIRVWLDGVGIENGSGGNAVEVITLSNGYVDILRSGTPNFSLELGHEPSGHMANFTSLNLGTLDFGLVKVRDKVDVGSNNLSFIFKLTDLDLSSLAMDVTSGGLLFTRAGAMPPFDMVMQDVRAGSMASVSMGSVGLNDITLTNLSVRISGKN